MNTAPNSIPELGTPAETRSTQSKIKNFCNIGKKRMTRRGHTAVTKESLVVMLWGDTSTSKAPVTAISSSALSNKEQSLKTFSPLPVSAQALSREPLPRVRSESLRYQALWATTAYIIRFQLFQHFVPRYSIDRFYPSEAEGTKMLPSKGSNKSHTQVHLSSDLVFWAESTLLLFVSLSQALPTITPKTVLVPNYDLPSLWHQNTNLWSREQRSRELTLLLPVVFPEFVSTKAPGGTYYDPMDLEFVLR